MCALCMHSMCLMIFLLDSIYISCWFSLYKYFCWNAIVLDWEKLPTFWWAQSLTLNQEWISATTRSGSKFLTKCEYQPQQIRRLNQQDMYIEKEKKEKKKDYQIDKKWYYFNRLTEESSIDMSFWVLTSSQKDIISFLARLFN